jgi:hypothetical protein
MFLMICFSSLAFLTLSKQAATNAQKLTSPNLTFLQEWNVTFGIDYYNKACEIIQTHDGGYVVVGSCGPKGNTPYVALIKIDAGGHLLWNRTHDLIFTNFPMPIAMIQNDDGGFAIVGNTNDGMALVKTNSEGKVEWKKTYSIFNDVAEGMIQTSDGGYLIVAQSAYNYKTNPSALIIKIGPLGEMQWRKDFGAGAKYFRGVVQVDDGSYLAAGTAFSIATQQYSAWLVKVDTSGNILWDKKIPATLANDPNYKYSDNDIFALIKTNDNGYLLAGRTASEDTNGNLTIKGLLIKTNSNGSVQWNKTYPKIGQTPIYSVIQNSDNSYTLTSSVDNDMILIKTDREGNAEYNQTFGDNHSDDRAISVIETDDGGFAVAGYSILPVVGERYFIFKTIPSLSTVHPNDSSSISTQLPLLEILVIIAGLLVVIIGSIIYVRTKRNPKKA